MLKPDQFSGNYRYMARPTDPALWARVKLAARRKFTAWPSAYASYWLAAEYKRRGGTYTSTTRQSANLTRWRQEKWVDICQPLGRGQYRACGRARATGRHTYPLCRPSVRVSARTPRTVQQLGLTARQRQALCRRKRRQPTQRIRFDKQR
jgi:hypothetical protein